MRWGGMPAQNLSARERALNRLLRIEEDRAFVSRVATHDQDSDDAREERQASEYVAGITRLRRWLDFLISEFYRGDFDRLEPALLQILRIGLYDLVVLETAAHAAVNEAVELAKRRVRPQAAGLVNGLLRAVQRRPELPLPATGSREGDLAVRYSQPDWLVKRWVGQFGEEEAIGLLEAANRRPGYGLRINTLRFDLESVVAELDALSVAWEPSPYLDDFVRVHHLQAVLRSDLLDKGACAVQDEAAGLVVRLLDPQPGETIIDAAAAPGGKAVYAAIRMGDRGRVLAYDVHSTRLDLVRQAARVHGVNIITAEVAELRDRATMDDRPVADRVLLDAPCSGLGVLAKRADMRWHRTEAEIEELCALQDELLDAAATRVRPGGLLVYSTCTTEPDENERRVEAFLRRTGQFVLERADGFVPDEMVSPAGFYLALPHRHGIDGAFGARLRSAG
jgi:16S rRNA (cytosine967-C5)-methyltransferase